MNRNKAQETKYYILVLQLNEVYLEKMYCDMVTINVMDKIMYGLHRQGRISFYMTNTGEEAVQIGSAAALTLEDTIYAQYREAGMKLHYALSIYLLLYASKI